MKKKEFIELKHTCKMHTTNEEDKMIDIVFKEYYLNHFETIKESKKRMMNSFKKMSKILKGKDIAEEFLRDKHDRYFGTTY